jgi:SAM-dependent methyltransferase
MVPPKSDNPVAEAANWDQMWAELGDDTEDIDAQFESLRWREQARLVEQQFGGFEGLRVVEIGAGRATNALLYAKSGADVTVLDNSPVANEQALRRAATRGLSIKAIEADVFALPAELHQEFDVSMSFGLCEHFLGAQRRGVVASHLELLRPGGLAIVNVPNRLSPMYRLWMGISKRRGTWTLGTEVPFSGRELADLARMSGGLPLSPIYVGGLGTLVSQGLNPLLERLGGRALPAPQVHTPILDYLAYDLMVPIVRPG